MKGSGELQKVVDKERKGPECLISKRRKSKRGTRRPGYGGGGYHKIHEMMLVGSGRDKEAEADCVEAGKETAGLRNTLLWE